MNVDIIHHYPPEVLNLLVDTIPLLCRSKGNVIDFFRGAGVPTALTSDLQAKLKADRKSINKYEIVREVLIRLNEKGESTLRERREVIKRVIEFEDFSTCWPNDQLKAKGLVSEIRRVVDVKDSFGRMRQEQEAERKRRLDKEKEKVVAQNKRTQEREDVKRDLYSLFSMANPQLRGKKLEGILNRLFESSGILIRDAFTRIDDGGAGVVEQIDGVVELDGAIYLVEMKWWEKPLGTAEVSQHVVRVFSREGARGLLISYSGYTDPAIVTCKDALAHKVIVLGTLQELVKLLEREGDLVELIRTKARVAVLEKKPFFEIHE
ncbi:restriction endonuclease [Verrucomicrobiaceae bacterium 227]